MRCLYAMLLLAATLPAQSNKALILHDMHYRIPTPSYIAKNKAFLETMPFDGIVVYLADPNLTVKLSSQVMTNNPHSYAEFANLLKPLRGQTFNRLKNNFVLVLGNRPADLFDDWSVCIQNFANLAQAAADTGLKGIFFDNEAYVPWTQPWSNYPDNVSYPYKSLADYQNQARLRGTQMMQAMRSQFPAIEVITAHGPYISEFAAPAPLFPQWQSSNELKGPLFTGFLEALGGTAVNVDGGELYALRTSADFAASYNWRKYTIASSTVNSPFIPVLDRAVWPVLTSIAFGVYDQPFGGKTMDAPTMQSTLYNAMHTADHYTWYFAQAMTFIQSSGPGTATQPWIKAVTVARSQAQK